MALELIEIRKEMVLRVDEQGRRWKVPHNLYRVRDHRDGYNLTVEDVLSVVELASNDRGVYRYVRRIFSPRFAPIDGDNVWHQILPAVREHECWQRLAEKALKEEARASARTKAGHAKRSKATKEQSNPSDDIGTQQEHDSDVSTISATAGGDESDNQTSVEGSNNGSSMDVASTNSGSHGAVDSGNSGLAGDRATIADQRNEGEQSGVDQSNTTYYESSLTTTTTTTVLDTNNHPNGNGAGPMLGASAALVACFEAANDREATPLEVELLAELETAFDANAQRTGQTGGEWVIAAIREAVGSGSRFVAPKRVREILNRWSNQGDLIRPGVAAPAEGVVTSEESTVSDFQLPDGRSARAVWERALKLLGGVLERDEMERLFTGSAMVDYRAGTIRVTTATAEAAERLSGEYYELVSRKIAEAMRRSVRIEFSAAEASAEQGESVDPSAGPTPANVISFVDASRPAPLPSFVLSGGLTNQQVWTSALETLASRVSPATLETWVRPASIIGVDPDGTLIVGAPNAFAQRRLSSRLQEDLVRVLSDLLGRTVGLRIVVAQEWLRQQSSTDNSNGKRDE